MEKIIAIEFEFVLPVGYRDDDGSLHRQGVMRLATAADEILPLKDHRVQSNPAYLPIIVLSRVVTKLGTLEIISTKVMEDLFSKDFSFLQDLYNRMNGFGEDGGSASGQADTRDNIPGNVEALPLRTSFTTR